MYYDDQGQLLWSVIDINIADVFAGFKLTRGFMPNAAMLS